MILKIFFDTNILLDHLLDRRPFADDAERLWSLAEERRMTGLVSTISFNLIYYIVRHHAHERAAREAIRGMQHIFHAIEVDTRIIHQAIDSPLTDFEDAIQYACALRGKADYLLTRNTRDFRKSQIPVLAPDIFLQSRHPD